MSSISTAPNLSSAQQIPLYEMDNDEYVASGISPSGTPPQNLEGWVALMVEKAIYYCRQSDIEKAWEGQLEPIGLWPPTEDTKATSPILSSKEDIIKALAQEEKVSQKVTTKEEEEKKSFQEEATKSEEELDNEWDAINEEDLKGYKPWNILSACENTKISKWSALGLWFKDYTIGWFSGSLPSYISVSAQDGTSYFDTYRLMRLAYLHQLAKTSFPIENDNTASCSTSFQKLQNTKCALLNEMLHPDRVLIAYQEMERLTGYTPLTAKLITHVCTKRDAQEQYKYETATIGKMCGEIKKKASTDNKSPKEYLDAWDKSYTERERHLYDCHDKLSSQLDIRKPEAPIYERFVYFADNHSSMRCLSFQDGESGSEICARVKAYANTYFTGGDLSLKKKELIVFKYILGEGELPKPSLNEVQQMLKDVGLF